VSVALNPTQSKLLALFGMDRRWVRGEGVFLFDDGGRRFLDLYAQYGAVGVGHNAPEVLAAVRASLDAREPAMVQPYRAPHAVRLAEALVARSGGALAHVLFSSSGAETIEAAIKLVRARSGRSVILSCRGSYHGKTLGALAATGQRHHAEGFGPGAPGFDYVPFGDADALAEKLESEGARIAAFLVEPIQGERGVFLPPAGYLARAREICTRHGVALVLDEVQTGLGRTGTFFAYEQEAVVPDVVVVAKALGGGLFPLGALLVAPSWWDDELALRHSSTFANNNVGCRVGLAVLDVVSRRIPAIARLGEQLRVGLERIARVHPRWVAAVRGRGLLTALELRTPSADSGLFLSYLHHQGLYAYAFAGFFAEATSVLMAPTLGEACVLRVAPPLVIEASEIDEGLGRLEEGFARLERGGAEEVARALGMLSKRPPAPNAPACASSDRPVRFPTPRRPAVGSRTFAFVTHYTRKDDVGVTDPQLAGLTNAERGWFLASVAELPPGVTVKVAPIRSATGACAEGWIVSLGLLPEEMLRRGRKHVEGEIVRAVHLARGLGADVVGLGGFTTPFSRRGRSVVGLGPTITTGNALTAGMSFEAVQRLLARRGQGFGEARVAVVGARGSVGVLCAMLAARAGPRGLLLVGNPQSGAASLDRLRRSLPRAGCGVETTTDLRDVASCDVVISATGAARPVLDEAPLSPGTIVCDVARPRDASPRTRGRHDLVVIDGGLVALPDPRARFGAGNLQGLPDGVQLACLSETILLALEGERRDYGIGDDVAIEEVDAVMAMARRHGFRLAEPPAQKAVVEAVLTA
jgi:acetylornithine/succinyldiaminopimelate/putrescine aminotransferase/predicted amino acid dehydrogenase